MGETGNALLEFTARAGTKTGCDANPFDIGERHAYASASRRASRLAPRRGPRPAQVVHRGWGLLVSCVPCLRPRSGTAGRSDRTPRLERDGPEWDRLSGFTLPFRVCRL
jgi:hypothetical protein